MESLIQYLISEGYLKTPRIIEAFREIKREDFVLPVLKKDSERNIPLPIGHGQTISQPLTVAFMLEKLDPRPGQKILDVGSGSGWTTALLAEIVGEKGKVIGIERIPEVFEFGKRNVEKYDFLEDGRVEMILGSGAEGNIKFAPYDRILVSASAEQMPEKLKNQLMNGGLLVVPIQNSIWLAERMNKDNFAEKEYPGFVFVPLIS